MSAARQKRDPNARRMIRFPFDWSRLDSAEWELVAGIVSNMRQPDVVLAPDGVPYLYRWHVVKSPKANTYLHIQVADDWERGLHDHPWDNQSVILAGAYYEEMPHSWGGTWRELRHPGDVIQRQAEDAHRLLLPPGVKHCITLFSTGPKRREWGFRTPNGWVHNQDMVDDRDGYSIGKKLEVV